MKIINIYHVGFFHHQVPNTNDLLKYDTLIIVKILEKSL